MTKIKLENRIVAQATPDTVVVYPTQFVESKKEELRNFGIASFSNGMIARNLEDCISMSYEEASKWM